MTAKRQVIGFWAPIALSGLLLVLLLFARQWNRGPAWVERNGARVLPDLLELQFGEATECTMPNVPGRWVGRSSGCRLTRGTVRLATGRRFRGGILAVEAPWFSAVTNDARFEVGAVADSGWIAVQSGTVHYMPKKGTPLALSAGRRLSIPRAGKPREEETGARF